MTAPPSERFEQIGVVVIGRNEGDRLRACLESLVGRTAGVVYVDSGSTDGSLSLAESLGVTAVALDPGTPFTAARGRQVGLDALLRRLPQTQYVQFIDGDCTLDPDWFPKALRVLEEKPEVVAVCGRRREIHTDTSFYSRLIDIDWDIPPGEVSHIGGDALMRVRPIYEVGGWPVELIAGEEPDLCFRLRDQGWRIWRIPDEATRHDIDMRRFGQYWKRAERSGFAYLQVGLRHMRGAGRDWIRHAVSIVCYGGVLPIAALASIVVWPWALILIALLYARVGFTMARYCRRRGRDWPLSLAYAGVNLLCKVAGTVGVLKFIWRAATGNTSRIIEYKGPAAQAAGRPQA